MEEDDDATEEKIKERIENQLAQLEFDVEWKLRYLEAVKEPVPCPAVQHARRRASPAVLPIAPSTPFYLLKRRSRSSRIATPALYAWTQATLLISAGGRTWTSTCA